MAFVSPTILPSARRACAPSPCARPTMLSGTPSSPPGPASSSRSRRVFLRSAGGALAAVALGASAADTLKIEDVKVGTGDEILEGASCSVKMHYTLTLGGFDGKVIDSSRTRGRPFSYVRKNGRGGVIAGWDEGVTGMRVGGMRNIVVPSEKGYGERGAGSVIPPSSTLYFQIELLGVGKA